jgi:hypothetical protein
VGMWVIGEIGDGADGDDCGYVEATLQHKGKIY